MGDKTRPSVFPRVMPSGHLQGISKGCLRILRGEKMTTPIDTRNAAIERVLRGQR